MECSFWLEKSVNLQDNSTDKIIEYNRRTNGQSTLSHARLLINHFNFNLIRTLTDKYHIYNNIIKKHFSILLGKTRIFRYNEMKCILSPMLNRIYRI